MVHHFTTLIIDFQQLLCRHNIKKFKITPDCVFLYVSDASDVG